MSDTDNYIAPLTGLLALGIVANVVGKTINKSSKFIPKSSVKPHKFFKLKGRK